MKQTHTTNTHKNDEYAIQNDVINEIANHIDEITINDVQIAGGARIYSNYDE